MLIYHPIFDPNHGMFRLLRLLEAAPNGEMDWDVYQIVDMYYLFPYLMADVKLPRIFIARKRRLAVGESPYNRLPSPRLFIQQIKGIHEAIVRSLAAKGFLEPLGERITVLRRTSMEIPITLATAFETDPVEDDLIDFLARGIATIPAGGKDGLRARTGLLEHRYDAV